MSITDKKLNSSEERAVRRAEGLSSKLLYEVVRRQGLEELERPGSALFWSGIAAGIAISASYLGEAIFRTYLPDAPYRFLIENLGYTIGFVIVILGRMQLFTENTITTVLPLLRDPSKAMFTAIARLWAIVIFANVIGAFLVAALFAFTPAIPPDLLPALSELGHHATGMPAFQGFMRAIPAGMLIAALVWVLPEAEGFGLGIIMLFTWFIAAGDFAHIVAGSVEMAFVMLNGELPVLEAIFRFFIPVFCGNVVGGTLIFACLAWGQVKDEIKD